MMNKIIERRSHNDFYTASLNIWHISSLSRQPKPNHALYQNFYTILPRLPFWIKQNTKILESYKNFIPNIVRTTLTDLESHQEQHRSTRTIEPGGGSP